MRRSLTPLGETEMEILHHVWELEEASVADVRERMLEYREVAYTTVMTIMKNLADKKFLKYRKEGLSYIYSAAINPDEVRGNLVHEIVDKVFKGSTKDLVQALVNKENLTAKEREEIKNLIDNLED
ncbi:BlaI/MecI/CopY family transcriptional regulator [Rhodohalobacter barkolensis]|jgi:BlaI family transcriptional regulator, penicillinase repressor|uniref:BlaI family transcriptional regulator n=1 Tax=Rhodohalobacter barkolensis TaxID=2053187 RepID=A0A2N0VLG8_9BACT|nr:BlaI/MecI/CopY family transcriptional regulator [Rhodohalobacter barkolensis]PKD45032.1 BlaI family transcriptional regulator [Rhodohalobacter barkolensis]